MMQKLASRWRLCSSDVSPTNYSPPSCPPSSYLESHILQHSSNLSSLRQLWQSTWQSCWSSLHCSSGNKKCFLKGKPKNVFSLSVMEKLPPTSYVRMVDIWLIFGQLIPFIEVALLTIMELFNETETINHHGHPRPVQVLQIINIFVTKLFF